MKAFARFADGVEVDEKIFKTLAKFAPDGCLTVLACDQHNSFLKMLTQFNEHARAKGGSAEEFPEKATDEQVAQLSRILAKTLGKSHTAILLNYLGFMQPDIKEVLGENTMLLARLEDSFFDKSPDGKGQVAKLAVQPEEIADKVDGFKTLVKLDPEHKESWELNLKWLEDVADRCRKLGMPLFNETLYVPVEKISSVEKARRLPEALVKIAEDFGNYGDFYKTQVPMLWVEDEKIHVSSLEEVREVTRQISEVVDRPLLILSAAVSFPQYSAQYAAVCDIATGPMCGRAYFKDPFSDPEIATWEQLETAIAETAVPRMEQIQTLTAMMSKPWWHKYEWMSDEAKSLIKM